MKLKEAKEALELEQDATLEDARVAYRKLALSEHPDKSDRADANTRFQRIQDAYTCIQAADEAGDDAEDFDDQRHYQSPTHSTPITPNTPPTHTHATHPPKTVRLSVSIRVPERKQIHGVDRPKRRWRLCSQVGRGRRIR